MTLIWTACTYPDNGQVSYEVYIGTDNPPDLGATNIKLTNYTELAKEEKK